MDENYETTLENINKTGSDTNPLKVDFLRIVQSVFDLSEFEHDIRLKRNWLTIDVGNSLSYGHRAPEPWVRLLEVDRATILEHPKHYLNMIVEARTSRVKDVAHQALTYFQTQPKTMMSLWKS